MPTEDAPKAENVDDPVSAEGLAVGHSVQGGAPLHPRWLRPTIVSVVILAHASTLIALANVSSSAPPAEETIEVNVIAAGDEAPVTTSADQVAQSAAEGQSDSKPEPTKAQQASAPEPLPAEPVLPAETPPVVEQEPTPPTPRLSTPPDTSFPPAPQEAASPRSLEAPPPAAPPPPVVAMQDQAPEPLPSQQHPDAAEAQMQPPPSAASSAPAVPPEAAAPPPPNEAPLSAPSASIAATQDLIPDTPPAPQPPNPIEARPQPLPVDRVRTQPNPRRQAKLESAERPKPHKAGEAASSAIASEGLASKPGSAEAHHVGEASGQAVDAGMSRASYAALVIAQIQAHRFYPESARTRGEQGAVGVSFTIGPNGRVGSAAVVRSSGFAELDGAAREILRSISPPPPPGGSFSASTTIRFHFE
jgi:protein TonB